MTLDFDSTGAEVYGRNKPGAGVNYQGQLAYQPLLCPWAQRGRLLATDLLAARGEEPRQMLRRALEYLPAGYGPVAARFDSGFYRVDLLADCRARGVRFSISVPRSSPMWSALERIDEDAWTPADSLKDAQVAETTYAPSGWEHEPLRLIVRRVAHQADALSDDPRARRKRTIPRAQLDLGRAGEADVVYGYSFILTDLDGDAETVELDANRVWLAGSALALNLLALLNDLMFGPEPPRHLPRRRQAKFVRRMLLCVPARVIHHARQIILRLPAALASAPAFRAARVVPCLRAAGYAAKRLGSFKPCEQRSWTLWPGMSAAVSSASERSRRTRCDRAGRRSRNEGNGPAPTARAASG